MWCVISVAVLLILFYRYGIKPSRYWKNKGVSFVQPLPFIGNCGPLIVQMKSLGGIIEDIYNASPSEKYVGFYQFTNPTLMIRDPDLIKTITVKEFDVFPNRQIIVATGVDPMWDSNLVAIQDTEKWHDIRTALSPSFSSGKLKIMLPLIKECVQQFIDHIQNQNKSITVDMQDVLFKYTNDVLATVAFGVTCNSFKNPLNEFYMTSKASCSFKGINGLRFVLNVFSATLAKILKVGILSQKVSTFFFDIVEKSIRMRKENGIVRFDMIHLLLEAKSRQTNKNMEPVGYESVKLSKNRKKEVTTLDIAANAVIYLLGGTESTNSFLYFTCYELAVHSDIQQRLLSEIEQVYNKCNGDVSYEALLEMNYLDMVLSEVLRKWPPTPILSRKSCKPFTIPTQSEQVLTLDPGTDIIIPVCALHKDAKYFPNPERFDPERFSDENRRYLSTSAYLPFGSGRRNCIGSRLAVLINKLLIAEILRKFEIVPSAKTQIPPVRAGGSIFLSVKGGYWLELRPRSLL